MSNLEASAPKVGNPFVPLPRIPPRRVAAIDCGPNSVRLLVVEHHGDDVRELTRRFEIVRLGEGLDAHGRFAPAALERARTVLTAYATELRGLGVAPEDVRMCRTWSTRRAAGGGGALDGLAREVLGVAPRTVSGEEEARLAFAGAVRGLAASVRPPFLVADIGGGSTRFAYGAGIARHVVSAEVGCVRVAERYLRADPPTAAEVAEARDAVAAGLDRALAVLPSVRSATLVGLSEAVGSVAALVLGGDGIVHRAVLDRKDVTRVTEKVLALPAAGRRALAGIHPGMLDVLAASALVVRTVMERTDADRIVVSEHDILDGVALDPPQ
ncbi:exopolyphosphatase [Streptomyces sp. NPDC094032]|uniref:Ppx/GppA phosphatase family protein n=1 Tax=Streptomyces sp. NPDC094032 TaxID=3155308 RepID=UPI0033206962